MGTTMTFADLFCGAGGLSLGLVLAGMEPLWALDSDPACAETYRANFPGDRFVLADARGFDFAALPAPDVLAGGPPCVCFSVAGRRLGPADPRDCIPDFLRAAEALRPRWLLMENVPGLLSTCGCPGCAGRSVPEAHRGRYFASVLGRFRALGYRVWWAVLDAADYGAPQFRKRVFVAANRTGKAFSWPEPTHASPAECRQMRLFGPRPKPWVSAAEALGLPTIYGDGPALTVPASKQGLLRAPNRGDRRLMVPPVLEPAPGPEEPDPDPGAPRHSERTRERLARLAHGESLYGRGQACRRLRPDAPAWTVTENHGSVHVHPLRPRALTPRECARLQTFPDAFEFRGSRAAQYRQVGNAVPPLLAWRLANAVLRAEGLPFREPPDARGMLALRPPWGPRGRGEARAAGAV